MCFKLRLEQMQFTVYSRCSKFLNITFDCLFANKMLVLRPGRHNARLPNGKMLNPWLNEKNNSSAPVEISRSKKGKQMLHVLYIIINISCPRKRTKNQGMSCNLLRAPTFMV